MSETDERRSTFPSAAGGKSRGSMSDEVTPTTPSEAVEWYLAKRDPELSEKSKQNHRYRLEQFLAFYSDNEIEDINRLMGRDIHRYGR